MKRVVPDDLDVVSRENVGKETVVVAIVSGTKVTVVIPNVIVGALEVAWKRINNPA